VDRLRIRGPHQRILGKTIDCGDHLGAECVCRKEAAFAIAVKGFRDLLFCYRQKRNPDRPGLSHRQHVAAHAAFVGARSRCQLGDVGWRRCCAVAGAMAKASVMASEKGSFS